MSSVKAIMADITTLEVDAIVNAANSSLLGGGGVDGAIHRVGGKKIMDECIAIRNRQGGCPTGSAVITTGGNLPARFIIHTVGPVWHDGRSNEPWLLASCYRSSLALAIEHQLSTVAFSGISTGVYGYPKRDAAAIAVDTVTKFLQSTTYSLDVVFVCFDPESYAFYQELLKNNPLSR